MTCNSDSHFHLAQQFVRQSDFNAAEAELIQLLATDSSNTDALTLLGFVNFRLGRNDEANRILTEVETKRPKDVNLLGLLSVVRRSGGDLRGALDALTKLTHLGQENADTCNNIGSCLLQLGDAVGAGNVFKRAIEFDRNSAHSYYNLGMALKAAGSSFETYLTFKRSIELDPKFHDSYVQIWETMNQILNWKEGLPILEQGLRLHPDSTQLMIMLASTYGKLGRTAEAEVLYRRALALDVKVGPPYAHWLQEEGRFQESVPILLQTIRDHPIQGQAYYNLAIAKAFEIEGKPLTDLIDPLLENRSISDEERMFLFYARAKLSDDQKGYQEAMANYDLANDLAFRLYNGDEHYDEAAVEEEHAILQQLYPEEIFTNFLPFGSKSKVPIFIVGMIRTGTTLLDQIVSSHPKIKSAGEQPFWQIGSGRINRRWFENGADSVDLEPLAGQYLDTVEEFTGGSLRITDKMPTNFAHIGLMSLAFPKAKFIHLRRNPMDTCLSIYTTFLSSGTKFAYNQENIVRYYQNYLRMMDFWRSVIPSNRMIEIDYEDLVTNKEAVVRGILGFCGLEWDEACLNHERNRSAVSTPSLWTARQPVNTASVERWRKYEPWLGQLLQLRDVKHPSATINLKG